MGFFNRQPNSFFKSAGRSHDPDKSFVKISVKIQQFG